MDDWWHPGTRSRSTSNRRPSTPPTSKRPVTSASGSQGRPLAWFSKVLKQGQADPSVDHGAKARFRRTLIPCREELSARVPPPPDGVRRSLLSPVFRVPAGLGTLLLPGFGSATNLLLPGGRPHGVRGRSPAPTGSIRSCAVREEHAAGTDSNRYTRDVATWSLGGEI